MSPHLDPARAVGIASLPVDDPERQEAEAHASSCPPCQTALEQAARVLAVLDAAPPPAPPSPQALDRSRRAVLAAWDSEAAQVSIGPRALIGAAAVAGWLLLLVTARHRDDSRLLASLAGAVIAAAAALIVVGRDRLALGVLLAGSAAAALFAGGPGELDLVPGLVCAGHEILGAALTVAAAGWLAATGRISLGATGLAAAAAAGAVASQAALAVTCSDHGRPHLLAFHFGAVVLAALAGAALVAARPRRI